MCEVVRGGVWRKGEAVRGRAEGRDGEVEEEVRSVEEGYHRSRGYVIHGASRSTLLLFVTQLFVLHVCGDSGGFFMGLAGVYLSVGRGTGQLTEGDSARSKRDMKARRQAVKPAPPAGYLARDTLLARRRGVD